MYEDELSDSKTQVAALKSMVGTLVSCTHFSAEDYDTLITKTTQYAAKLLKKPDQCKMVTLCSHLFWVSKPVLSTLHVSLVMTKFQDGEDYHDARRVLECLQRSLKIADVCMSSSMHVHLFVDILNEYLYYFENENEMVVPPPKSLSQTYSRFSDRSRRSTSLGSSLSSTSTLRTWM